MRQQFLLDTAETFQAYVYENNRKLVPDSAIITVTSPGGDTAIVSAQAMTVQADGRLDYDLTADSNDTADDNYKAIIAYVSGGTTFTITLFYDVVISKLVKVITDEDIVAELPQLRDNGWRVFGTSESGSTTTIIDADLVQFSDDYFTGGLAYSITQDETREITDFVSSTGTVTTIAFGSSAETDKYVLTQAYTKEIQRAFEKIEDLLIRKGRRPHLILDPQDLREVHIIMSVTEICKGLVRGDTDGVWWDFMTKYDKLGFSMFNSITFKYDESEDGVISDEEEEGGFTRRLGRG